MAERDRLGSLARITLACLAIAVTPSSAHEGHRENRPAHEAAPPPAAAARAAAEPEEPPAHPWGTSVAGRSAEWLGQLHPVTVHFPIALLLAAAAAEGLLALRGHAWLEGAVRFCVAGGALLAPVVAALGWLAAGPLTLDEDWLVAAHRWSGSGTALLALVAFGASERAVRSGVRRPLRLALWLVAVGVAATGFLGGSLVHGIDHLAWPAP